MNQVALVLGCIAASLYPSLVTCVKWPDNSTQYKGYIEVTMMNQDTNLALLGHS